MTWPNIYRNLKRIDYCTEQFNMIRSHSQSRPCQSCTMMFHHDAYQCCVLAPYLLPLCVVCAHPCTCVRSNRVKCVTAFTQGPFLS